MKILLTVLAFLLLGSTIVCGVRLHETAMKRTHLKETYGQLNSFTYGLLSADAWKEIMRKIVTERVNEFQSTKKQERMLQAETEKLLDRLIVDAQEVTRKNKNKLGTIKTHFAKSYLKTARDNVDKFAGTINAQIRDPETMKKFKQMVLEQFEAFAASTHSDPADTERFNQLLAANDVQTVEEFNAKATQEVQTLDRRSYFYSGWIFATVVLFMMAWRYVLKRPELHSGFFLLSVLLALSVLLTSLSIPMMEIDARLRSVDLMLIGERVHFQDQVIYYRSKSLMQVVVLLAQSNKVNALVVGFLLILFSILFPITKLLTGLIYLRGNKRFNNSKFVQFFAFKSGKWSMADVTVVAIFMSYIGFESILNAQLPKLNMKTEMIHSITTDASSLQAGFFLFTTFVLYSMGLSEMLKRIAAPKPSGI